MIQLRMSVDDLERMRFAYSPLAEVAESIYLLTSGRAHPLQHSWLAQTRPRLKHLDTALLGAVVPARLTLARFLLAGARDPSTTIESQLELLASFPPERIHADLATVWAGELPPVARELVAQGAAGVRRLVDNLWQYWSVAVEPHWPAIRAVLDDDVAYRAGRLTDGGIEALLSGLHPEISVRDDALRIDKPMSLERDLSGGGLLLVPSVFAWPNLLVDMGTVNEPSLTYASRGVGTLWEADRRPAVDDALAALLGRGRAAILRCLAQPRSTTDLALALAQSAPTVSQHLSILRRSGLVTSQRSGRLVLYRRTALATSILVASEPAGTTAAAR